MSRRRWREPCEKRRFASVTSSGGGNHDCVTPLIQLCQLPSMGARDSDGAREECGADGLRIERSLSVLSPPIALVYVNLSTSILSIESATVAGLRSGDRRSAAADRAGSRGRRSRDRWWESVFPAV